MPFGRASAAMSLAGKSCPVVHVTWLMMIRRDALETPALGNRRERCASKDGGQALEELLPVHGCTSFASMAVDPCVLAGQPGRATPPGSAPYSHLRDRNHAIIAAATTRLMPQNAAYPHRHSSSGKWRKFMP